MPALEVKKQIFFLKKKVPGMRHSDPSPFRGDRGQTRQKCASMVLFSTQGQDKRRNDPSQMRRIRFTATSFRDGTTADLCRPFYISEYMVPSSVFIQL